VVLARKRPLIVVVDALDETSGDGDARRTAQRLLKPLATAGRTSGVKVLVGTRRGAGGELLDALGPQKHVIDLDTPQYLERDDLIDYVRRLLLRDGEPGAHTPYRGRPMVATRVAEAIADRAGSSFLVAQLASRFYADPDEVIDTSRPGWERRFPPDEVSVALARPNGRAWRFVAARYGAIRWRSPARSLRPRARLARTFGSAS